MSKMIKPDLTTCVNADMMSISMNRYKSDILIANEKWEPFQNFNKSPDDTSILSTVFAN